MEKISFIKMSGAGNDFIIIDKAKNSPFALSSEAIIKLCDRRNGIGADGVIEISQSDRHDFEMDYYNSDGSIGTLCGNGSRCAIWYAHTQKYCSKDVSFLSKEIVYGGVIIDSELVKFYLKPPQSIRRQLKLALESGVIEADFIDTGSPHIVIDVNKNSNFFKTELNKIDVARIGKEIRYHKEIAPEGANVNFINIFDNRIFIRTYERGVEEETLACGTGSVAAAIISFLNQEIKPPIDLITKSNENLKVDFISLNNSINEVSLTGPAKIVFTGVFSL